MSDETRKAIKWGLIGGAFFVLILVVATVLWPIE